jgi:hypothetical protein
MDYTTRVICVGENEIGKIKFCIYFFSINQFFFKFLEISFLALITRDEFELEFSGSSEPELWRFRAEPSRAGALQFSSW